MAAPNTYKVVKLLKSEQWKNDSPNVTHEILVEGSDRVWKAYQIKEKNHPTPVEGQELQGWMNDDKGTIGLAAPRGSWVPVELGAAVRSRGRIRNGRRGSLGSIRRRWRSATSRPAGSISRTRTTGLTPGCPERCAPPVDRLVRQGRPRRHPAAGAGTGRRPATAGTRSRSRSLWLPRRWRTTTFRSDEAVRDARGDAVGAAGAAGREVPHGAARRPAAGVGYGGGGVGDPGGEVPFGVAGAALAVGGVACQEKMRTLRFDGVRKGGYRA